MNIEYFKSLSKVWIVVAIGSLFSYSVLHPILKKIEFLIIRWTIIFGNKTNEILDEKL